MAAADGMDRDTSVAIGATPLQDRRPQIRFVDLHRRFGDVTAVAGVSFDVMRGEFLVLLGPSGCGKTTILRMLAGFETPTGGDVLLDGKSLLGVEPNLRNMGFVFQHLALFPHLTVFQNVAFGLQIRNIARDVIQKSVQRALEGVHLAGKSDRLPSQLSGGQRQRVALARALVINPSVLILDEPLGALDTELRREMQVEIRRLQREIGITSIMVTHDQEEAMTMGDRIAILKDGKLCQIGTPAEIYSRPASAFAARFLGGANIFDVQSVSPEGPHLLAKTIHGLDLRVEAPARLPEQTIAAVLRPEAIIVGEATGSLENVFVAHVAEAVFTGPVVRCRFIVAEKVELSATLAASAYPLRAGDTVKIGWSAASLHLVGSV